jgi:hypothetical protein
MAYFSDEERSSQNLDYVAITSGGVARVTEEHADDCRRWLSERGYTLVQIDFSAGMQHVLDRINELFQWREQFGYTYSGHSLDALRDGFWFDVPVDGGLVFELHRPDLLWKEHSYWIAGLLELVSEHSAHDLESRFFALLVMPQAADSIGNAVSIDEVLARTR